MEEYAFKWGSNVEFINSTDRTAVLGLAGPKSRDVLSKLTSIDLSDKAFPFMTYQDTMISGVPTKVIRISYTGIVYIDQVQAKGLEVQMFSLGLLIPQSIQT